MPALNRTREKNHVWKSEGNPAQVSARDLVENRGRNVPRSGHTFRTFQDARSIHTRRDPARMNPLDLAYIVWLHLRAKVPNAARKSRKCTCHAFGDGFFAVCTMVTRLVTAPSPTVSPNRCSSTVYQRWWSVSGQAASLNSRPRTSSILLYATASGTARRLACRAAIQKRFPVKPAAPHSQHPPTVACREPSALPPPTPSSPTPPPVPPRVGAAAEDGAPELALCAPGVDGCTRGLCRDA